MPPVTPDRISLPDRYRVVRHLASGGMASVWEAHDQLLERDVAVKLLAPHLGEDERARRRFQREARAAAGLSSHPNVVTIYDVGEHRHRVFMVMEIMRGGTVSERLKAGGVAPATAVRWLREAAGALDTAHAAGVVHRDIKPGNLLLDGHDRLAVADFGIARVAWEDQLTQTGQVLGTAAYLSPEQAMGEAATAASDRYALAVVAYELLTGARPFDAEHFAAQARAHIEDPVPPASSRAAGGSGAVDAVLERGLAKEPGDRWGSAAEFVDALARTLDGGAEPTKATRRLRRADKRAGAAAGADGARGADPGRSGAAGRDRAGAVDPGRSGARGPDTAWLPGGAGAADAPPPGHAGTGRAAGAPPPGHAGTGRAAGVPPRGRAAAGAPPPGASWVNAADEAPPPLPPRRSATRGRPAPAPRRRGAGPLVAVLAALALLVALGVVALVNRNHDQAANPPRAQHTPTATATATATAKKTAKKTATATATATGTATASPSPSATPTASDTPAPTPTPPQGTAPPSGSPSELQAKGHTALQNGDIQGALTDLRAAIDACGGSSAVDPCAYAMYDYADALVQADRPQEAVPVLQARLQRFDDQNGVVRALLRQAQGGGGPGRKKPKGNG